MSKPHKPSRQADRRGALVPRQSDGDPSLGIGGRPLSSAARQARDDARSARLLLKTLATFRKALRFSQADVADRMETSQSAVSDIEKGIQDPRLSTLQRFARALDLELQWSLAGTNWILLYAWDSRSIQYHKPALRPMRVDDERSSVWLALIDRGQSSDDASPHWDRRTYWNDVKGECRILPFVRRDPGEDRYLSESDLIGLSQARPQILEQAS
jgi:transcriptional regulator with XRE-family HTH domain